MIPNKKSSIILVLKILEKYTDEEHYLTQPQIVDKIRQIYDVELERKSVGSSLQLLEELDYDIDKGSKGGFALLSRTFDKTEAEYLVDAVFSSRSISGREAKRMAEGVTKCFNKYQRNDFSYIYKTTEINRTTNKQVLYNLDIINEAIKKGKRVGFRYLSYDDDGNPTARRERYQFIVSPYYLINNFGRYYLLCNYREKYRPLQTFRIDYMINIEIKNDWPIKTLDELEGVNKNFSLSKYINDHIYLMGGDTIEAEFALDESWCVQYVKDWFGDNARIKKKEGKIHAFVKCNENALYYWVMQYSDCVTVLAPSGFAEKVKSGLKNALRRYENEQ